jgi:hypothetical protein
MKCKSAATCFAPVATTLFLVFGAFLLLAVSCKPSATPPPQADTTAVQGPLPLDPDKVMIGEWVNQWLHVELTTAGGTPLERVVDVREENWVETFKRTPLHTHYTPDHTFYWEYFEKDSLIKGPVGSWSIVGDSIIHVDTTGNGNNFHYKLIVHSDSLIEFRTMVDWDFDGAFDDKYYGKMRRARAGE